MSSALAIPTPLCYAKYFLKNIEYLRNEIKTPIPIEIWEVGDELNNEIRDRLSLFPNITFKNTLEFDDRITHWRGFQAKAPVLKFSKATDIIICDADVTIFQDPLIIQNSKPYIDTGSYMFRDFQHWYWNLPKERNSNPPSNFESHDYYDRRKNFVKSIAPVLTPIFPREWAYIYNDDYPSYLAQEALAESGVFFINRDKNQDVIDTFYELNNNHNESYKCVHGDKELVWLSFIKNNKSFSINHLYPVSLFNSLTQLYNNNPFYIQKLNF